MDYTQLRTAIQDYAENDFNFAADPAVINNFIEQAETRVYTAVQFPALRKTTTLSTTAANPYLNCPSDFLSVFSLAIILGSGAYEFLLDKDVSFIRSSYPNPSTTGTPRYYAIFGPQTADEAELRFLLGPTPASILSAELQYFYYPESIVTAGNTWLGDNFDPVLLYGALVEAATYMKQEQDLIALYDGKFKEALALAKQLGAGLERSDAYRNGQARVPMT